MICIYRFLEIKILRMSRQESVNIALEPDNKENAWNNIFNLITVLWLLGYIGYQFYIEWSNWDAYESQFNNTWRDQNRGRRRGPNHALDKDL